MKIYQKLMKTAVRVKRVLTGNSTQTEYTAYLEEIQYKPPEELLALQAVCLCELLKHAIENIPYYKYLKGKLKLEPETIFDDIKKFPVIEKKDLMENRDKFIAGNIKPTKEIKTGGTMGKRAVVFEDKYFTGHAVDEYFNKVIGIVPGKSRLIFNSDESKKPANKVGGIDYEFNPVSKVYRIDHRYMNDRKIEFILNIFKQQKPDIVWGNTHAAYVISQYFEKNNIKVHSPELFLCGGQILLPRYTQSIERVFGSTVYDRYGSVEGGNTANQCKEKDGYHYIPTVHFIEILDEEMQQVAEGETGEIYITTLTKRAMPMIRYKIGDLVKHTEKLCTCGCNFPLIAKIQGRGKEGIISPKGTYISGTPLNMILNQSGKIQEFQALHTAPEDIKIRIVCPDEKLNTDEINYIIKEIGNCLDYKMNIKIEYANVIKAMPNGKMLRIVPLERYKELGDYFE